MQEHNVIGRLTSKMKKKWVAALRSGEYKQGKAALCNNGRYCCLGVLQDVAPRKDVTDESYLIPDTCLGDLEETREYARRLPKHVQKALASMNDTGVPFEVIAGFIEENIHVRD